MAIVLGGEGEWQGRREGEGPTPGKDNSKKKLLWAGGKHRRKEEEKKGERNKYGGALMLEESRSHLGRKSHK